MKIVAPRQLKVKLMLFSALCIILATLTVGSRLVTMNDAIDAAATLTRVTAALTEARVRQTARPRNR